MANIINGKELAANIRQQVKAEIDKLGITPGLAVILVGNDPASHLYVSLKAKACREAGIHMETQLQFASTPEGKILEQIARLNERPDIHGIIVQLPLPEHLDEHKIIQAIEPTKDVDGFHPTNIERFMKGEQAIKPVLVGGVMELLNSTGETLKDKIALVIANSPVFTRPMVKALENQGLWAEALRPDDLQVRTKAAEADVLIVAVGRAHFVTQGMIKQKAIVIDIGTNRETDRLEGDVDREAAENAASWRTPVPGGVGPVTVAMLLANTLELAKQQK